MVLLGVAAERVFILLCEAMTDALQSPREQQKLADAMKRLSMKPRLEVGCTRRFNSYRTPGRFPTTRR